MSGALDLTAKDQVLLVDFSYGASFATHTRLALWSEDVSYGGNTYTSALDMAVDLPERDGGLEARSCVIELAKANAAWLDRLADGLPHSPVKVVVLHLTRQLSLDGVAVDDAEEVTYLFRGRIRRRVANPGGEANAVRIEVQDVRGRMSLPAGIVVDPECAWPFAGNGCQVDPAPYEQTRTIDSISGNQITLASALTNSWSSVDVYTLGHVEVDGLRIEIRSFSWGSATLLQLAKRPPDAWDGASATIRPGCKRTLTACTFYANVERRIALGKAIPDYHPGVDVTQ
jgi:hypothetical protein